MQVNYKLNGWYFGNIIFGGAIGMLVVDPATGAMWKIIDPVVDETLVRSKANALTTSTTPTLNIINIADVSKEVKSQLVRVN